MKIIPAIDIINGKCVRLTKGDYSKMKIYNEDPLEVALQFEDAGLRHLHLVDLDGAKAAHIVNWKVLEKIATKTKLIIDFGGGLKSDEDLLIAFNSGANQITAGSIAVINKNLVVNWINKYGADKIILGADVNDEKISISGWQETTNLLVYDFIKNYTDNAISYCICTDISKDGMLEGPSTELYVNILKKTPELKLIASGGVSTIDDLFLLQEKGLYGAIVGKAIYEGKVQLFDLANQFK